MKYDKNVVNVKSRYQSNNKKATKLFVYRIFLQKLKIHQKPLYSNLIECQIHTHTFKLVLVPLEQMLQNLPKRVG